ncbi:MAG: PspC domain-containing protein [Caldisericales bacterium]|nr:PspC domain-containing protein [Caldisericales bacterium]
MEKRLYRSRKNRVLGGVCGGLADYLNLDVSMVRLVAILVIFFGGLSFLAYIVLWIVVPEEPVVCKDPPREA